VASAAVESRAGFREQDREVKNKSFTCTCFLSDEFLQFTVYITWGTRRICKHLSSKSTSFLVSTVFTVIRQNLPLFKWVF